MHYVHKSRVVHCEISSGQVSRSAQTKDPGDPGWQPLLLWFFKWSDALDTEEFAIDPQMKQNTEISFQTEIYLYVK